MPETDDEVVFSTEIREVEGSNISIMCLSGEMDTSSVPAFLADAHYIIAQRRDVIVDVHMLDYIDSTGVSALLSTRKALIAAGNLMYLTGCHGLLSKILHITQVESELLCLDDVEAAITMLKQHED